MPGSALRTRRHFLTGSSPPSQEAGGTALQPCQGTLLTDCEEISYSTEGKIKTGGSQVAFQG